jgi:hypothetical protein
MLTFNVQKFLVLSFYVLQSFIFLWLNSLLILVDSFLLISSGIIYGYYAMILKIDEDDFGGHSALLQEGLFASITLFLVVWLLPFLFQFFLSQK